MCGFCGCGCVMWNVECATMAKKKHTIKKKFLSSLFRRFSQFCPIVVEALWFARSCTRDRAPRVHTPNTCVWCHTSTANCHRNAQIAASKTRNTTWEEERTRSLVRYNSTARVLEARNNNLAINFDVSHWEVAIPRARHR